VHSPAHISGKETQTGGCLTITIYQHGGSVAVCSKEDGLLVYFEVGEAGSFIYGFHELGRASQKVDTWGLGRDMACLERTVLVMPSVKRTNSIVSRDDAHSGTKASTRLRALRWESALSYDKLMCRISGAMAEVGASATVGLRWRGKLGVCEEWEF
jgi:hypothetical protein